MLSVPESWGRWLSGRTETDGIFFTIFNRGPASLLIPHPGSLKLRGQTHQGSFSVFGSREASEVSHIRLGWVFALPQTKHRLESKPCYYVARLPRNPCPLCLPEPQLSHLQNGNNTITSVHWAATRLRHQCAWTCPEQKLCAFPRGSGNSPWVCLLPFLHGARPRCREACLRQCQRVPGELFPCGWVFGLVF